MKIPILSDSAGQLKCAIIIITRLGVIGFWSTVILMLQAVAEENCDIMEMANKLEDIAKQREALDNAWRWRYPKIASNLRNGNRSVSID